MDTFYRFFLDIMLRFLTQDLGNSKASARSIAVTNLRLRNASCYEKRDFKWVLLFRNMHNPHIYIYLYKNTVLWLHQTLLTWVSKDISKSNESTDATHIWSSGQILMCLKWSSAPDFKSSNSSFFLVTGFWVLPLCYQKLFSHWFQ